MSIKSMDDLPDVEHTFAFRADLAELLVPETPVKPHPRGCTTLCLYHGSPHVICLSIDL